LQTYDLAIPYGTYLSIVIGHSAGTGNHLLHRGLPIGGLYLLIGVRDTRSPAEEVMKENEQRVTVHLELTFQHRALLRAVAALHRVSQAHLALNQAHIFS